MSVGGDASGDVASAINSYAALVCAALHALFFIHIHWLVLLCGY